MILAEREPTLPRVVEQRRTEVLHYLRAANAIKEYDTVRELTAFLESEVLDGMARLGMPRGLTRVLLFYRNPKAIVEVSNRMLPGMAFDAFQAPQCWRHFGPRLKELEMWARRIEPQWITPGLRRG
jgi:hypothetical protein